MTFGKWRAMGRCGEGQRPGLGREMNQGLAANIPLALRIVMSGSAQALGQASVAKSGSR